MVAPHRHPPGHRMPLALSGAVARLDRPGPHGSAAEITTIAGAVRRFVTHPRPPVLMGCVGGLVLARAARGPLRWPDARVGRFLSARPAVRGVGPASRAAARPARWLRSPSPGSARRPWPPARHASVSVCWRTTGRTSWSTPGCDRATDTTVGCGGVIGCITTAMSATGLGSPARWPTGCSAPRRAGTRCLSRQPRAARGPRPAPV